jgi:hypothetical protein
VAESEVDVWMQLYILKERLSKESNSTEHGKLEVAIAKLEKGLTQRTRALSKVTEYIEPINKILRMPGMHGEFSSKNLDTFSKGRTVEVCTWIWWPPDPSFEFLN